MPRIASWDILSRPLRQAQGRLYGTGPYPRSYPGLTSWATLSRPLRQAQGRLCGTEYWIGRFSHRLLRAGLTFGGRPSRPRISVDFAVSFISQLAASKSAPPNEQKIKP